jgi:hypothetical protein
MKKCCLVLICVGISLKGFSWGFFGHKMINYYALFLLPPEMMVFFKPNIAYITEHAVDPDKRRYALTEEGPRHYIDIDRYGLKAFESGKVTWTMAVEKFTEDTLKMYGIVPWWIQVMHQRLSQAFRDRDRSKILKLSAEIGHYIGDAHVPLHTSSNHNGQFTDQRGIHGFWESRVPELLAEKEWDLFAGRAGYIKKPLEYTWTIILESAKAADSVLSMERMLNQSFPADKKFAYETRNGLITKQYSTAYTVSYNTMLGGMIERRLHQSIHAVASFWYTAWVNAGQPDLKKLVSDNISEKEKKEMDEMEIKWRQGAINGKSCD